MQGNILKGLMAAALIGGMVSPVLAQDTAPPAVAAAPEGAPGQGPGPGFGPGSDRRGPAGLKLAGHLSALETLVGITADQQAAWRGYSDAVLAFAEGEGRDERPGARGAEPSGPPQGAPIGAAPPQAPEQTLMAERLADRAIVRGERAAALKEATATLRAALSPEQFARLVEAEVPLHAPGGPEKGGEHGHEKGGGKGGDKARGKGPHAAPHAAPHKAFHKDGGKGPGEFPREATRETPHESPRGGAAERGVPPAAPAVPEAE
ncbi:hypothetical protein [Pseudogemmobacter sonorensis]|uniref:hypothetical protein n=1 Tax=Pseudogemmobacter sonorensis TaxID=2989681 RepID=UPI00368699DD